MELPPSLVLCVVVTICAPFAWCRLREEGKEAATLNQYSRNAWTWLKEGYKEVTLLGQNVDSYYWAPELSSMNAGAVPVTFAMLLEKVAQISPALRVRFSTSHPKDITDEVLHTMAKYENICNNIHLPLQSGSTRILQLMNRTYTREWYMAKVNRIRELIPDCGISSDIIAGFCTETEEDHRDTLNMMEYSRYDFSYMFFYSERPGTLAHVVIKMMCLKK